MSQIFLTNSPKHCAKHGVLKANIKLPKKLLYGLSTFLLSLFSLAIFIWLILHPSKPEFYLKEADIYQLNLSSPPHLLNSSIQLSLVSKNPNKKVGIYYDQLQVYASYKGQQISVYTSFPPFYQGHEDSNLLTASLVGNGLPVGPSFGYEVVRDQTTGRLILSLKANGRLRWRVWTWVSGPYRFNVNCVTTMDFGSGVVSAVSVPLSSNRGSTCSTTV